jgi:hypothetical protein
MAPDWETSARSPGRGIRIAKVALNFAAGTIAPRQFGPTIRSPFSRAARSAASANEPVPWPSPAVKIMAAATPRPAAAAMICGTDSGGEVITATSGTGSIDSILAAAVRPSISR